MMIRSSIFALMATAVTFAAEGVNITVNATVDSRIDSVTVKAGSQTMGTIAKNGSATWAAWGVGTVYTPTFTGVATGYEGHWTVTKSGQATLSGGEGTTINIPTTSYSGCSLSFYGQAKQYNVTLDRQGGSGGTASVTATYDSKLPAPITAPTRTGYTFGGYFTGQGGSGTQFYAANGYTWSTSLWQIALAATLYAKWTANTYTVTLDRQGGSGGTASVTATYDSPVPIPITAPTRTGYTFGGYFTGQGGSGTQFYSASGYTWSARLWQTASAATLYAKWTANTYAVTLDRQGGSGGKSSVSATYNATLPSLGTLPTRSGYTFGGYYSAPNGGGKQYYGPIGTPGKCDFTSSTTLYAKWTAKTYAITVDPCGGTFRGATTPSTYDTSTKKLETGTNSGYNIHVATRAGYTLGGFYDAQAGGNLVYGADGKAVDGVYWNGSGNTAKFKGLANASATSLTVYARWTPNTYTVALETYGGTLLNGWTSLTNYTVGVGLSLPTSTDIEYANHTFVGWYDNEAFDPAGRATSISSTATGAKTFYVKWNDKIYNVSFDANGGTGRGEQALSMTNPGQLKTLEQLNILAPRGYTFDAWNTSIDGSGDSYVDGAVIYNNLTNVANATVTLYAQWTPNPYEVAFHPNGADGVETMDTQQLTYDIPANLTACAFTRTGHAFSRWSSDTNYNYRTEYYLDGAEVTNLTAELNAVVPLYANWTGVVYSVTFDANGGDGAMEPMSCIYNVPTNLTTCTFERDGWGFKEWTNDVGEAFIDHARVTNLTATAGAEVALHACWTGVTYAVTLDARDPRGEGVMTNDMGEAVNMLTNLVVVGNAWNLPTPTNVNENLAFVGWKYGNGQTAIGEVPPPSSGSTILVAAWSWVTDDLAAAVDAPELGFRTFATVGVKGKPDESEYADPDYSTKWFAQTNFIYGSTNAVQSGRLPVNADDAHLSQLYVSWLTTTVETNGVLSFYWKCDAQPLKEEPMQQETGGWAGDTFRFGLFDSALGITNEVARLTDHVDWCKVVYTNKSDSAVSFAWAYVYADYGYANGGGTGWVDRVTWTPEGGGAVQEVTPTHGVPFSWLREKFSDEATSADEAELEALAESASPDSKVWPNGDSVKVWQDYWAGTNPNDPNDLFHALIAVTNGVPAITWWPDMRDAEPPRVYRVLCAPMPSARLEEWVEWPGPGTEGAATNRFFKVELDWEESRNSD